MLLGAEQATPLVGVLLAASLLWCSITRRSRDCSSSAQDPCCGPPATRNLDQLGGLMRRMPVTGVFFMIGALAIMALPPLNGFVSEWLLFQGLVPGGRSHVASAAVTMPLALASSR